MFKKSRHKIIAAIMFVLILLLFATFCIIFIAGYTDMTTENRQLLKQYADTYTLPGEKNTENPPVPREKGIPGGHPKEPPMLELSTVYSAAISKSGETLAADTADVSAYSEEELLALAGEIIEKGSETGITGNLLYRTADKGDYILVAFLDNTLMLKSIATLLRYTIIFGVVSLIIIFFLARYLAGRIVSPLEESYQKQKQFISDAGHELKTPVAVMDANIELLSRETGENQWLSNIRYENERMSSLIVQLLDLARTENVLPFMEPVDLGRLVYGEILPFETVAYEKGLLLNSSIAKDVFINGNSVQLKQLASILIDNAIRHGEGGKEIGIILKREKHRAIFSISNEGPPIPPEQQKHLFERFYRSDPARAAQDGNYGLGLAIARAIVTAHKGSIDVQCRDGKVFFLVKIPLLKTKSQQPFTK